MEGFSHWLQIKRNSWGETVSYFSALSRLHARCSADLAADRFGDPGYCWIPDAPSSRILKAPEQAQGTRWQLFFSFSAS
jgi:hypothetical protein